MKTFASLAAAAFALVAGAPVANAQAPVAQPYRLASDQDCRANFDALRDAQAG